MTAIDADERELAYPQGFHPEHRNIELLKLRNYTVGKKIDDSALTSDNAQDQVMAVITPLVEFVGSPPSPYHVPERLSSRALLTFGPAQVTYLNSVVMPDPNLDSDSESEQNGEDGGEEDEEDEEEGGGITEED